MLDLSKTLGAIHRKVEPFLGEGKVADYIPALARVDARKFGMAVALVDGRVAQTGHAEEDFSIQSISKVFTLTMALRTQGEALWQRVGREASGDPFNSIVQLEHEQGIPRNPFINAGAITVCDVLLAGRGSDAARREIRQFIADAADNAQVTIDEEVAASERSTGHRNASLAHFMKAFGTLAHPVLDVLDVYFCQCAVSMNCVGLARAGLYLAHGGSDPWTGKRIVEADLARRINAIMLTCGHYDASGDFAYRVGLPGKSGVGGGILAIVPGIGSVAVWSPGLNAASNSLVGTMALEELAQTLDWSVF